MSAYVTSQTTDVPVVALAVNAKILSDELVSTADVTNDRVQAARTRTEKTVRDTLDHLHDGPLYRRVYNAARQTDGYVRDHSWGFIAGVAGVALLLGLLMRRD